MGDLPASQVTLLAVAGLAALGSCGALVAVLLLLRGQRPAAGPRPEATAAELRDAAESLALAGKFLGEAVEPFRGSVAELSAAAAKLDTTAIVEPVAAAGATAARVEQVAERLVAGLEQVEVRFEALGDALAPARDAGEALGEGLVALAAAQGELVRVSAEIGELLRQWQERQGPVTESLARTSRALDESAGSVHHLVVQLSANQDGVADNLAQVYTRLNAAAERLELAVAEWGTLVRSGLAGTQEFSRQAVEALLAALEQSPPDVSAAAEAALRTAASAETLSQAATTSLTSLQQGVNDVANRLAQLAVAVDQHVQRAVAPLVGGEVAKLGATLTGVQQSVTALQQAVESLRQGVGAESGPGLLATELQALRAGQQAGPQGARLGVGARVGLGLLLAYVVLALGLAAGILPDFLPW